MHVNLPVEAPISFVEDLDPSLSSATGLPLGSAVVDIVVKKIPYDHESNLYRLEDARLAGEATCFAQAEGVARTIEELDIDGFIGYYGDHAFNVMVEEAAPVYLDSYYQHAAESLSPAFQQLIERYGRAVGEQLKTAHTQFMNTYHFADSETAAEACYFWIDTSSDEPIVVTRPVLGKVADETIPEDAQHVHLLIEQKAGIEMLHAIGDLGAYLHTDPQRFVKTEPLLMPLIPVHVNRDVIFTKDMIERAKNAKVEA